MRDLVAVFALVTALALVLSAPAIAQPTCGQTITEDTTLESDLICGYTEADPLRDGLVIGASGITLNLNGYTLGANHYGVRGTVVRDNTVTYEQTGIWLKSGASNVLVRNRVTNAPRDGNCFTYNGTQPPNDGLHVDAAATGTVLRGNSASKMRDDGIDTDAPNTYLRRNAATENGDLGIEAVAGATNLGGNRASGNGNPLQCTNVFCR